MGRRRKRRSPVPLEESTDTTSDDDLIPRDRFTLATGSVEGKRAGAEDEQSPKRKKKGTPSKGKDQVPTKKRKIYKNRESLLTQLCAKDKNIEALYHVLIIMICVGLLYSLVHDSIEAGKPHVDFRYYFSGFGPLSHQGFTLCVWAVLQLIAFSIYPIFKLWVLLHNWLGLIADLFFLALLGLYNLFGYGTVIWMILYYDMYPVTALVLNVEQLRFCMKTYSFVRENAYKVLYPWSKDDKTGPAVWYEGQMSPKVGSFRQYIYFLFCPTLLYRDHYPRTPRVRWMRVLSCLIKCCITIAFITILTKSIFSLPPTSAKNVLSTFLTCSLWGLLYMFMTGYFFLHSWLNLFSELFTFADREFYSINVYMFESVSLIGIVMIICIASILLFWLLHILDWWTCHDFASFYRKWNLLVHDWIKAYIYSDLKDFFKSPLYNKVAFLPTIVISGIFHEYVLWAPLRFIMPLLLLLFGIFGSILFIIRPSPDVKFWNYFLHIGLHFGVSLMIFLYTMEFYARALCPKEISLINTFVPRFYECYYTMSSGKEQI